MDINEHFPMLCYVVDVCTEEGYRFHSKDENGIRIGRYETDWLRIRTKVIDSYSYRTK